MLIKTTDNYAVYRFSDGQEERKKRLIWIDIAKGIAILLVLLGHIIYHLPGNKLLGKIYSLIYSFHMPLFFIISGYTLNANKCIKQFMKNKFKTLGWWYLIFVFLWTFYSLSCGKFHWDENTVYNTLFVTSNSFYSIYWFLPALVVGELLSLLIIQLVKEPKKILLLALLLYICAICYKKIVGVPLPVCADSGMLSCFFIIFGWLLKEYDVFYSLENTRCKKLLLKCSITGVVLYVIFYIVFKYPPAYFGTIDIGNPVVFVCTDTVFSLMVIIISISYERVLMFLSFFGRNSLILYMVHYFFLSCIETLKINNIVLAIIYIMVPSTFIAKCFEIYKLKKIFM